MISKPEQGDPRFLTSVSLLCVHDDSGSLAFILNHPLPFFIQVEDFSVTDTPTEGTFPLFRGGPVGTEQCFFLMKSNRTPEGSQWVKDDIYLGANPETLKDFLKDEADPGTHNLRFFLGYAGWSFFQLDCELSNNWWFTLPEKHYLAFDAPHDNFWLGTLEALGPEFLKAGHDFLKSDSGP